MEITRMVQLRQIFVWGETTKILITAIIHKILQMVCHQLDILNFTAVFWNLISLHVQGNTLTLPITLTVMIQTNRKKRKQKSFLVLHQIRYLITGNMWLLFSSMRHK